jgi:hypothetical protein
MFWKSSKHALHFILFGLLTFSCTEKNTKEPKDLSHFSEAYLRSIQEQKTTTSFQDSLKACSMNALIDLTKNRDAHLSFWLNIYNASVQVRLQQGLDKYTDKDRFFNAHWINIAGKTFSLNDIERGILGRKAATEFLEKIRCEKADPRIHFALNCGANSCPPIRIYSPKTVQHELEQATRAFLQNNSSYSALTNTLTVDELFNWYTSDFNGENGIIALHQKYSIVPLSATPKLVYSTYDWTVNPKAFEVEMKN